MIDLFREIFAMANPEHIGQFINAHGMWVYAVLFAIIFVETGLVIMPFLPGDSLLFTAGAVAAIGNLNVWLVIGLLIVAGVLGDAVNYHIGKFIGPRVFSKELDPNVKPTLIERLLNRNHLNRANEFYRVYGGKAVILGRFVPIVRTFVPFVAGAGAMNYGRFALFNVLGAVLWVGVCVGAGYFFGNIGWVKKHFEAVVVGIIVVSLIPLAVEFVLAKRRQRAVVAPGT
jgi:membrane-associated protein